MSFEFSFLDQIIAFDKSSNFVTELTSPVSGSVFLAKTSANDPTVKIICSAIGTGTHYQASEPVIKIPLADKSWKIDGTRVCISLPGYEPDPDPLPDNPVKAICIGGAEDLQFGRGLKIELDDSLGKWRLQPDLNAKMLYISFGGHEEP